MPDTQGNLLPVYVVADESFSMSDYIRELNDGLVSLYEALRAEPMIATRVRLAILGFSDDVEVRLRLVDLRDVENVPRLRIRNNTNYQAVFTDLLTRIPHDVDMLKASGYLVHRPAVFFLSDGQPNNSDWLEPRERLTNKTITQAAPNIVAFGIGDVMAETILQVATDEKFAFVAMSSTNIGTAIAKFFVALTRSIVQSGRSLTSPLPELVVAKPEGFRMSIDLVGDGPAVRANHGDTARPQPGLPGDPESDKTVFPRLGSPGTTGDPGRRDRSRPRRNLAAQGEEPVLNEKRAGVSVQGPPPQQSAPYDELVRSAFAELVQPGRLLFNPPDRMQLGDTERVEVRLTRTLTLDAELLKDLRGHGEPRLEDIPTSPLMAVTLKGDGFRITPYSDEEQSVTPDRITTWEFDIRALKRGQQRLVISVSLRIPVAGQPLERKSIPVREATIDVQVGAPALIVRFVSANWQWFVGTVIAIAAVLVAVLH